MHVCVLKKTLKRHFANCCNCEMGRRGKTSDPHARNIKHKTFEPGVKDKQTLFQISEFRK